MCSRFYRFLGINERMARISRRLSSLRELRSDGFKDNVWFFHFVLALFDAFTTLF